MEPASETVVREAGPAWSPAQVVSFILGLGFIVLGAVALARAGLGDFFTHVNVAGLEHTQVLALIHLAAGVMFLGGAVSPFGARGSLVFLGALALVFGIIVFIEPTAFTPWLGVHQEHGVMYIIVGAIALVFGIASPIFGGYYRYHRRWWW